MAFICRKPFTHKGTKYRPGDVVAGFPEDFFRGEGLIRTGFIVERADVAAPAPAAPKTSKKKSQPKVEVEEIVEVVVEDDEVVEVVVEAEVTEE